MSAIPSLGIPELAGVATYAAAAHVGFSVMKTSGDSSAFTGSSDG
jgi:hypothetical protein